MAKYVSNKTKNRGKQTNNVNPTKKQKLLKINNR